MKNLIERQAAIDAVDFGITFAKVIDKSTGNVKELFQEGNRSLTEAIERIKILPTAEPEQRWIPCSERMPEDFQSFYATCRSNIDNRENWVIEGCYTPWRGFDPPPLVAEGKAEIIAWMPKEIPEPYQEEKHE